VHSRNPVTFAKDLLAAQGLDDAFKIVRKYSQPLTGWDGTKVPHKMQGYYQNALAWMNKHNPDSKSVEEQNAKT
jgi:hypothetical protein